MARTDSLLRASVRSLARLLLAPDCIGGPLARLAGRDSYLATQRQWALKRRFEARCARYFSRLTVASGPFAGLRYPSGVAYGSALFPKLLGIYESELQPSLARFHDRNYDDIIDIGFAEGYYLIGLAQWFPAARIWGFDPSAAAHRLCTQLGEANAIPLPRLRLANEARDSSLAEALRGPSLVICDCEGFEAILFTPEKMNRWKHSDLIIECHDFIEPGLTDAITRLLAPTHEVECIPTRDPSLKIPQLPPALHEQFSREELAQLVSEGRPAAQSWIVATSRARPAAPTR
jgi:hypothetical protein